MPTFRARFGSFTPEIASYRSPLIRDVKHINFLLIIEYFGRLVHLSKKKCIFPGTATEIPGFRSRLRAGICDRRATWFSPEMQESTRVRPTRTASGVSIREAGA